MRKIGKICSFILIDPFRIRCATSVPLGKGTKFALHHGKLSTTKRRAIQILHISTFQFTFKCGYNDFISKYTDINSLHATQITLLHNNTCCSTKFARFRCKKGSLRVNSVMILVVSSTHAELASATARGRSYCETGEFMAIFYQYFMNKPSYYFYLTEFWSETLPMCSFSRPKPLTKY